MIQDIIQKTNQAMVLELDENFTAVEPGHLGLDERSALWIYLSDEGIVVHKNDDGMLNYYGGFEYVDKKNRYELGDWVFYSRNDEYLDSIYERWESLKKEPVYLFS
jgi:uncharacterized protein YlbG (UPF0298 family)